MIASCEIGLANQDFEGGAAVAGVGGLDAEEAGGGVAVGVDFVDCGGYGGVGVDWV